MDGFAAGYEDAVPMMRLMGFPPGAQPPGVELTVSRQTFDPVRPVPQWVMEPLADVTVPPGAMWINVPLAEASVLLVGVVLSVKRIPLTSCPSAVGLVIRLDRLMVRELVLVMKVADALSGPSPPVPEALKVMVSA